MIVSGLGFLTPQVDPDAVLAAANYAKEKEAAAASDRTRNVVIAVGIAGVLGLFLLGGNR